MQFLTLSPTTLIASQDAKHVKRLSETAQPTIESDYIAHLDYTAFQSEIKLVERIHEELSHGNPVIMKGYPSKPVEPTLDSLDEVLGLKPYRVFEAIGRYLYISATHPTKRSLKKILSSGRSIQSRIPTSRPLSQIFAKVLGAGVFSASWTARPSTVQLLPLSSKYIVRRLTDSPYLRANCGFRHLDQGHTAWPQLFHRFQDRHYVPVDVLQSKSWILAHTPLVHTYPHHDAEGANTWTLVGSGHKIWIFLRPSSLEQCQDRKEFFDKAKPYLNCVTKVGFDAEKYPDDYGCFFICAEAGDIM